LKLSSNYSGGYVSGKGAPVVYLWKDLFKEYSKTPATTLLKDWCEEKGLNYHNTSRHFAEIKRKIQDRTRAKIEGELLEIGELVPEQFKKLILGDDGKLVLGAGNSVLEKIGFTSQAATILVQQNNNSAVVIPPLFAASYQADAERMLGGAINSGSLESPSKSIETGRVIEGIDSGQADRSGDGTGTPDISVRRRPGRPRKAREDGKAAGTDSAPKA
jgi:hypothetical protein